MKIMVFLHGTTIMHSSAVGRTRHERVRQVIEGDPLVYDFAAYVPVGQAVAKLQAWQEQGADVVYLSSRTGVRDIETDKTVLARHGFPLGEVFYRGPGEAYGDVVARVLPDLLVEDDCESIGGEIAMTYPQLPVEARAKIQSVVVQEFGGLDHLPDEIAALARDPAQVGG
jgi:hypothetical protein